MALTAHGIIIPKGRLVFDSLESCHLGIFLTGKSKMVLISFLIFFFFGSESKPSTWGLISCLSWIMEPRV